MKLIADIIEKTRPGFEGNGTFSRFQPVFRAADHFFFASTEQAATAPWGRDALDVKRYMSLVILALLPCLAAAVYFFGLRVLAMIAVSYAAGGMVEVAFAVARKEDINEGFLVTGLIFPLILPPALPLWMVALGVVFGVLVGKEIFGGTGRNLFNPALLGRCFLFIGYPAAMSGHWITPGHGLTGRWFQYISASQADAITTATPLAQAKQGIYASLSDVFFGHISGSCGETSALAILLGGLFLLAVRVISWRTVLSLLGSYLAAGLVLHGLFPQRFGPTVWHLLAGGLLFGAIFMATDPVTSPLTHRAKWAYGALVGLTALLMRNLTGYVESMMFAILLGNIFAPSLDEMVLRLEARRARNERQ